ncbi:MAG: tetratricopeptide repeat protein [Candidatus Scalindua sp.]|nr:tetratricopeptide repeat protein [Candidatus Scalindua sp.]
MENSEDLFHKALKYHKDGNLAAAETSYRNLLDIEPGQTAALILLSTLSLQKGDLERASELVKEAIMLKPEDAETYNILGVILQKQGKFEEAAASYGNAMKLKSDHAEIYNNLGAVLIEMGRSDEAIANYKYAIVLKPDYADAHYNLANALKRECRLDEAVRHYRKAITFNPDYIEAHNNLGVTLKDQGRYDESLCALSRAISLSPDNAEAHNNCGIVLQEQGRLNEALLAFDKAIASKTDYGEAQFNRSMLLLLKGRFTEAWPEYEKRLCTKEYALKTLQQPEWKGSPLNGESILVHAEQGFGDTIQFARYLPLVQSKGGRVIFECWPQLLKLLENGNGIDEIVEMSTSGYPAQEFDFHIPLMSLPGIFDTKLETIPSPVPYIVADLRLADEWQKLLAGNDCFRIGIVWSGNPENRTICLKKSCTLRAFADLSEIPGLKFYSLQKGPASVEVLSPPEGMDIINLEDKLDDFSDTAAVIANLDLVISVDTAVAHLAGALGKPVWILLPFVPDWRWLMNREDSPWYPSMRLFRQTHPGDWAGVFNRVGEALAEKMPDFNAKKLVTRKSSGGFITDQKRRLMQDSGTISPIETTPEARTRLQAGEISGRRSTVSLCMIVKDEEGNLARCLDSVNSLVDEMIIVDTGSRDRTVEIAQRYGADVYYHAWENSFSKARNYSLQYATSKWILIMDADEELNKSDISRIKELIKGNGYSAISFVVKSRSRNSHNESYTNSIRLFRNFQGTRYDGIVHNVLSFRGKCLESSISITHYGYNLSEKEMEKKFVRTYCLLQKQIRTDPCNPVPYRYLGILYLEKGEYGKAIRESKTALELTEIKKLNIRDFLVSYYVISAAGYGSGRLQEAEFYALKLIGLDNRYVDGFCILAFVYADLKRYDNFLEVSEKYLALLDEATKEPKGYNSCTFHTIGHKWKIHLLRGFFYLSDNQIARGESEIDKAVAESADIRDCLTLLGEFYRERNDLDKAEETYVKLLNMNEPSADTMFKIGQVKVKRGCIEEAVSFWRKAVDIDPTLFAVRLLICKSNIVLDKYEDVVADCDQLLKALNLPRSITLRGLDDLGDMFEDIGKKLYERDDVQSAETAFTIKNDLRRIHCHGEEALDKEHSIHQLELAGTRKND